jgi:hypothetical protein
LSGGKYASTFHPTASQTAISLVALASLPISLAGGIARFVIIPKAKQHRTLEARLSRAKRADTLPQELRRVAEKSDFEALNRSLQLLLPDWPIRAVLIGAVAEIARLQQSVAAASAMLGEAMTKQLAQQTRDILLTLVASAERLTMLAAQNPETRRVHDQTVMTSDRIREKLERESEWLGQISITAKESREGLAVITLSGGSRNALLEAETRLKALIEAREQLDEDDQP